MLRATAEMAFIVWGSSSKRCDHSLRTRPRFSSKSLRLRKKICQGLQSATYTQIFPMVLLKIIWFATNFIELGPFATSRLSKAIQSQNDLGRRRPPGWPSQTFADHHLVNQTRPLSVMSSCFFNISLGSPLQCSTTLSVKKFFLMSNLSIPWCSLRLCPLTLSLDVREKWLWNDQLC